MTNEEIAALILNEGRRDLIHGLWDNIKKFVYMRSERFYCAHMASCCRRGVELGDIKQAAYIAFLEALDGYQPERGKFLTFMGYTYKKVVYGLMGLRTARERQEPLNNCCSLDAPIQSDEDEETTLADLQADEESTKFIEKLEAAAISNIIMTEVEALPDRQEQVVKLFYFENKQLKEIAELLEVSAERVRQIRSAAERSLRRSEELRTLWNEYYKQRLPQPHKKYYYWLPEHYEEVHRENNYLKVLEILNKA